MRIRWCGYWLLVTTICKQKQKKQKKQPNIERAELMGRHCQVAGDTVVLLVFLYYWSTLVSNARCPAAQAWRLSDVINATHYYQVIATVGLWVSGSMQRRPFLSLHERFRAVNIKYFKQIFFGTFKSHHLTKLSHCYTTRAVNEDPHEVSGMVHLLRCLEVYSQAISSLHRALSDHRIRLSELAVNYTFSSIRDYNHAFLTARILTGQDNPLA